MVFHILASENLHTNQADEAYIRIGDKSKKLSFMDRIQLTYDKGLMYFEKSPVIEASMEDIDMEAVLDYCNKINYGKSVREFLIESQGYVVKKDGKLIPTVATILLFGKRPQDFFPYAKLRFIRYDGTEEKVGREMNVIKDVEFTGTIKQQIDQAVAYLKTQISEHTYLGKEGLFVTDEEYPEFVRQEIIVNAACHRDYNIRGTDTHIKMFTNRLVVESPGRLPGTVRPDNIRHTHFSRNPLIAEFLKAYEFEREYGEGVDRMCNELEAADCGDVIFFPYAFMLRATVMNRIGYAQTKSLQVNGHQSNDERFDSSTKNNSLEPSLAVFEQQKLRMEILRKKLSTMDYRKPTISALEKIIRSLADNEIFGTKEIRILIDCSGAIAWKLINILEELGLAQSIKGKGKGRYKFNDLS